LRIHVLDVTHMRIGSITDRTSNTIKDVLKRVKEKVIHWPLESCIWQMS